MKVEEEFEKQQGYEGSQRCDFPSSTVFVSLFLFIKWRFKKINIKNKHVKLTGRKKYKRFFVVNKILV